MVACAAAAGGCGGDAGPAPALLSGVVAVSAGGDHACALLADATARCWGEDAFGELGDGSPNNAFQRAPRVVALSGITAVAAGGDQTCALTSDGSVSCWGNNQWGELGTAPKSLYTSTPTVVPGLTGMTAVAATGRASGGSGLNQEYSCALSADGRVFCWGDDSGGALGDGGSAAFMPSPVAVAGLTGVTQVALGGAHACALLADHTVACWGTYLNTSVPVPTLVAGLDGVVAVAAGSMHTCALLAGGTVSCWGDNFWGQLGTGAMSLDPAPAPVAVRDLSGVTAIAAGGDHTCALLADGTVRCWGSDDHGQLGNGSTAELLAVPTAVQGISGATAITAGNLLSCALLGDGTIRCWGNDEHGELGDESTGHTAVATPVGVRATAAADATHG